MRLFDLVGVTTQTVSAADAAKLFLAVGIDRSAAGDEPRFTSRFWGRTDPPFRLESGESLTTSKPEVSDPSDFGGRRKFVIRVIEQGAQGQLVETTATGAMWMTIFRYRVNGGMVTPVSVKDIGLMYMLLAFVIACWAFVIVDRALWRAWCRRRTRVTESAHPPAEP